MAEPIHPVQDSLSLPEMTSLWQTTLGWQPTTNQQLQFQYLYNLILAGNQRLNLTRITDPLEFWEKHLWDSLRGIGPFLSTDDPTDNPQEDRPEPKLSLNQADPLRVIDIGTGAGFPGIPVAIAQPGWQVTLMDATRKKIRFLETGLADLNLPRVLFRSDRAEELGREPRQRETYDLALLRAIGPASVCAEYALPLLKQGGLAVLYRGQWTASDSEALQPTLEILGGCTEAIAGFTTPISGSTRHCLYIRKVASTSTAFSYPVRR